ncbi:hypothetical protein [Bacillus sp. LK10]|uniref:hypothetical protein n=1 Tax=Bacillus sp. LK10 TaxID=1628211 RepID=UPI00064F1F64|nr:hypothetical protein [Bacillus sp. LK10]KML15571.1 hypothetical protein VL09_13725 [Bacillus stratosphericus]QAR52610.1 hypothetical protein BAE_07155 [Bacillus aerophilus]KML62208.1 hypothetical protein VL19_07260 [Bacillus stratosphericus]KMN30573.1 hypothetical protein ABW26_15695 [Bacillus stratosphericus]KMN75386.1 hypothetical protein VK97_03710 [Bacillus sp. LK10]
MKKTAFYDWTIHYPEHVTAVKDDTEKKMVFLEQTVEFKGMIRIDENDELQIKPTWGCVIIMNAKQMSVTVRDAEDVVGLP